MTMNEVTLADLLLAAYAAGMADESYHPVAAGMADEPYHPVAYDNHCKICRRAILADKHLRIMIQLFMIDNPTKPY